MDVIILAGGKGSRMGTELPKPLVMAGNKPILFYQFDFLLKSGLINNIIISIGHKAEVIIDYVSATEKYQGKPIYFSVEDKPLGTAGGLKKAIEKTNSEYILVFNCDDIVDIDLKKLRSMKHNTICVAHPRLPFGRIREKDGFASFEEKPLLDDWVSCGWYLFNRAELINLLPTEGSLEYEVFPKLKFKIYEHTGLWRPLNTKKDINEFEDYLTKGN